MKKVIIGIGITIIIVVLLLLIGIYILVKDNPDFAPYISRKYDKEYTIKSDIYDLKKIKDEMTKIAQKYEKEIKLTYIEYDLESIDKGTVEFQFYKGDYNGKNKACLITIKVDVETKKTVEISYIKGHGKRVGGYSVEIVNKLNENVLEYIQDEDKNISIIVTNFDIKKL